MFKVQGRFSPITPRRMFTYFKGDGHAKLHIGNSEQVPTLVMIYGLTKREAKFIWGVAAEHQEELLDAWEKIHG